jgi:hypothetical protein
LPQLQQKVAFAANKSLTIIGQHVSKMQREQLTCHCRYLQRVTHRRRNQSQKALAAAVAGAEEIRFR